MDDLLEVECPDGWKPYRLVDLCSPRRSIVTPTDSEQLPYVGLEHIDSGQLSLSRWGSSSEVRSSKTEFEAGDVLYGKLRPYLEKAVLAPWRGLCTTELLALEANQQRCLPEYLIGLVHSKRFVQHAIDTTGGTNLPRTSWNGLKEYRVAVPPLPEQKAIGHVLRTVHLAKEAAEKVGVAARLLKASMMRYLFTYGMTPFHESSQVELIDTDTATAPARWNVKRFDEIVTLQRGQDLARRLFVEGNVPVIGATSVIGYHNVANVRGPGVTVVRSGSSAGLPQYVDRDFWAHNVVLYVKDYHGNNIRFIYYLIHALRLTQFRAGVAVPTLNRNTLSPLTVAVPSLAEQEMIVKSLDAVDRVVQQRERRIHALNALLGSLLNTVVVGSARLSDMGFFDRNASKGRRSPLAELFGKWPGDETDEEVRKALEEMD